MTNTHTVVPFYIRARSILTTGIGTQRHMLLVFCVAVFVLDPVVSFQQIKFDAKRVMRHSNTVNYASEFPFMNHMDSNHGKNKKARGIKSDPQFTKVMKQSVSKQYQYVQGGFQEVTPPKVDSNSTSSMYMAFDSALRASSYNMFCSPLLPVEPPTPFRSKSKHQAPLLPEIQLEDKKALMDREAELIAQQYREMDKYFSSSAAEASRIEKKQQGSSFPSKRVQVPLEYSPTPVTDMQMEMDYEQLQNLLGFERMGATSQMNSATFKGNMSKHRVVSCLFLKC